MLSMRKSFNRMLNMDKKNIKWRTSNALKQALKTVPKKNPKAEN